METSIANPVIPEIIGIGGFKKILPLVLYKVYKYCLLAIMFAGAIATLLAYSYVWGYIDKKMELLEESKKYEAQVRQPRQSQLWADIKP